MNLDRRKIEFMHDIGVLDLSGLCHSLALKPLSREAGARDGRSASEGLELGVHDGIVLDLDLKFHDIAAFRSADDAGTHPVFLFLEAAHIAGVVEVIDHFFAISHIVLRMYRAGRDGSVNAPPIVRTSSRYPLLPFHIRVTSRGAW